MLNDHHLIRYSRQILLPDIDIAGQERLLAAHILIIGLGGLGSPAAMYLAGAGVGRITLADFDVVEVSNLHRQIAHGTDDIGINKAHSAKSTLTGINPTIQIDCIDHPIDEPSLQAYVVNNNVDVIIDATDNFASRHAINRVSIAAQVPLVSGAAIRMEGQISVFDPRNDTSPCYACLYSENGGNAENCAQAGVIGPAVGVIASLQALETLKLLIGFGQTLVGRVQLFDAKHAEWRTLNLKKDPKCPVCSKNPSIID
ncbi:MAG: molybdopterin-synthase adenylyltransferase MoeB [Gammaproteobacteria bacterium]|nr:molybdopterin-synthase adenylyltransferase MoeB [Gammaproteobacteria bacterium]